MASITKKRVRLEMTWDKEDPANYQWRVVAWGSIADDAAPSGEREVILASETTPISRAAFQALTGQQIVANVVATANNALQAMGTGAGGHTIVDDLDGDE